MQFTITNLNQNINSIMRQIGYIPAYLQKEEETSIVRRLGRNDYPRFHLYIKEKSSEKSFGLEPQDKLNTYVFSLHLDQKKPSYEGSVGHSGEYDGDLIENEVERIKKLLG